MLSSRRTFFTGVTLLATVAAAALAVPAGAQEADYASRFRVYTGQGEPASLDDILSAMEGAEAVLVGETHTDPVGHWIEAELLRRALERLHAGEGTPGRPVALSLEMFERDVQLVLDEYLRDLITESQFLAAARPWEYYEPDYRPMVEMAKAAGIPVIAANAPRRYVNRVTRLGREALQDLPEESLRYLPPLPYPEPTDAYREEWMALMRDMPMEPQCPSPPDTLSGEAGAEVPPHPTETRHPPDSAHTVVPPDSAAAAHRPDSAEAGGPPSHNPSFMVNGLAAQTLWDASMAHAVAAFLEQRPGALVLHMVGGFHVQNFTGIPEKLEDYRPGTRRLVVYMEPAEDYRTFDAEKYRGAGDFVILTDKDLDLNYQRNCVQKKGR